MAKVDKIHVTQASASEIRAALGITPAEKKVAAKAMAAAKKPATAHREAATRHAVDRGFIPA